MEAEIKDLEEQKTNFSANLNDIKSKFEKEAEEFLKLKDACEVVQDFDELLQSKSSVMSRG